MTSLDLTHAALDQNQPVNPLDYALQSRDEIVPEMVQRALVTGHCALALQPIVTSSQQKRRIAFHECLIRVMDSTGRIIPAGQFMDTVEDTSLGRDIDCTSLRLAGELLNHDRRIRLSVNVSARSLGDGRWRRILDDILIRTGGLDQRLILEISEESAMHLPEIVTRFMAETQPKGISFALDDFGAGMISFRYLKDFLFDFIKIDPLFVRNIDKSSDNQVITESLITIAHQFEMFAIAEGVETKEEADFLESIGADCLQGYYFGVPRFVN